MNISKCWIVFLVLLCTATLAFGQNGTISGSVKDQSGAVVPGATVVITNVATGVATRVTSLEDGKYLASSLQPGRYELSAEAAGFKKYVTSGFDVHVADNITLDIPLEIGGGAESVTVTAEAPVLRVADAQRGEIVDNNFISNMPQLNRDPFALVALSGNVQGSGTSLQLNGGRTSGVDYYVDGGVVNTGQANQLSKVTPSMDAVAEFKVVTSGISAEYGRISGGYVTLVTKSGTNEYHGSLYEYMFNDMFNANSWLQNASGGKKAHFRQNNFGFTLGGPVTIPKVYSGQNRTFFFVDNEYLRKNEAGSITLSSVPTDLERAGDFSQTLYNGKFYPIYDPYGPQVYNTAKGLWERTGFIGGDGKHVPANLISPVSKAILAMIPKANRPATAGSSSLNNYGWASSSKIDTFRFGVRLDHNLTDTQRVNMRYTTYSASSSSAPTMDTPLYTTNVNDSQGGINGNLNYMWSMTPTTILDLRSSVVHSPSLVGATHPNNFTNSFLPSIYQNYLDPNDIPGIMVTFMGGTDFGKAGQKAVANSTTYDFSGSVTKVRAQHTIKIGGQHRRYYDNFLNAGGTTNVIRFMGNPVAQFQGDWGLNAIEGRTTGLASFLLGINNRNNVAKPTTRAMNTNYFGFFVQDDWKLTQKLTLNLGVRYDNERPTTERMDKLYFWDPDYPSLFTINPGYDFKAELAKAGLPLDSPVPSWVTNGKFNNGAVLIANTNEFKSRSPQLVSNKQFAPRVGLAYQVTPSTVVRVSGGKMYLPSTGNPNSYATSNSNVALSDQAIAGWHASTDGGRNYISTWATPFPLSSMFTSYTRDVMVANKQSSLDPGATVVTRTLHMPREYSFSLDVQRQLPFNLVAQIGYAANRGYGLLATDTISHYPSELLIPKYAASMQQYMASPNAGQTYETTITGPKQQLGLLQYDYPYYGRVQVSGLNLGKSVYDAMNVRLERRLAQGLSVLSNYTLSRLKDDVGGADGQGGKTVQSVDSYKKAWGLSPLDRLHKLNLAFTYEVPFGTGRPLMSAPSSIGAKVLDKIVGGWQFAGNYSYSGGNPVILTASTSSNINNTIKVNQTWGSYATDDHNLINPNYQNDSQVLYGPAQQVTSSSVRWLDPTKVVGARSFISGNLPPTDSKYRNPPIYQLDISLMKNFMLGESRYLQIRGEAQNALNVRGFGNYQTQIGNIYYGLITTAGNAPRQIQLSARISF